MFRKGIKSVFCYSKRLYCDAPKSGNGRMTPVLTGERGVNQVTLIGRVGQKPEMRGTEQNPVTTLSLATSQTYRTPEGEYQQLTDWHRISVFRPNLRDRVATAVNKGDRVFVKGAIRYSQYTNKDGQLVSATTIIAEDVLNLSRTFRVEGENESYTNIEKDEKPV